MTHFFDPRSVAIVGASRTPGKAGYVVMSNLRANGYAGRVYPINPNATEIMGHRVYSSVKDLPEVPDVAVIIVPAAATVEALKECAESGIKAAIIESGGFTEVDERGASIENEMIEIIHKNGIRVMGPNTSGLISTPSSFITTFYPQGKIRRGSVAYVAQTGNFATFTMHWIQSAENFGVSRVVGLGNKCDVDDAEALEFLGDDPETKVVCMYVEGFRNGRRFIDVAREVSKKKPIILLKGGMSASGSKAVLSHTASLREKNPEMIDGILKQAGVVRIQKYTDLMDSAKALAFQPLPKGNRVAIIAPSGAMGVVAADACERLGLKVASLSETTIDTLQRISQPWIKMGNPVDIFSAVLIHSIEESYQTAMEAVLSDQNVDAVVSILVLINDNPMPDLAFIPKLNGLFPEKPLLVCVAGDKQPFEATKAYLEKESVPVYLPVEGACEALATMYQCSSFVARQNEDG